MAGRFQLAVSGTTTLLLDSETGNVYQPVKRDDGSLVWGIHIRGDVMRRDKATQPLRTLPFEANP